MLAQAPFSASPELHAGIQPRLDQVVDIARETLGDALRSVILGGSLARGRAFGVDDGGELRLLSDLDLYFVTEPVREAGALRRRLRSWVEADPFLVSGADVAVVGIDYFGEARAAMPTHQLAHAHRVLWGAPVEITGALEPDGRARVDATDAAQLLFNRCVEALDPRLSDAHSLPALVHCTKRYIDAPMAWLAARGDYAPDRRDQIRALTALTAGWAGVARERLDGALEHWSACLDARDAGVVDRASLESLARVDGQPLPGGARWEDWTGGFAGSLYDAGKIDALHRSLESSLDPARLAAAGRRWLRREPVFARLRRARRWCSVAPSTVLPWWCHGAGGSGPDRIFAAATLCVHGVDAWADPLAGLVREPLRGPGDVHALWWRWIQGRDDEA